MINNLGFILSLVLEGVIELWLAVAVVTSLTKLLTLVSLLMDEVPFVKGSGARTSCRCPLPGPGGGFSSTDNM